MRTIKRGILSYFMFLLGLGCIVMLVLMAVNAALAGSLFLWIMTILVILISVWPTHLLIRIGWQGELED